MRVLGLAFAVLFAVTVPIATHANGPRSIIGGNYGTIPRGFMDDNRSGKRLFRAPNGGISVFAPWQFFCRASPRSA